MPACGPQLLGRTHLISVSHVYQVPGVFLGLPILTTVTRVRGRQPVERARVPSATFATLELGQRSGLLCVRLVMLVLGLCHLRLLA